MRTLISHLTQSSCFEFVEHMDDLDGLFGRISQLLRNDGLLFIAVPNAGRVAFNEQNGSLLDTPPNHIGRWSPAAFRILGSRHCLNSTGTRLSRSR